MSVLKPTVGLIGTGFMGKPMARNLLKAGYPVYVHNRTAERMADLIADGAIAPGSPAAVAAKSDVVITMLIDWGTTHEAIYGRNGVMEAIRPGSLFIDMGTTSPNNARQLERDFAKKTVEALDAPVSGGEKGAIEGTLSIMAGGTEKAFGRAKPIFEAMGKAYVRIGDAGAGQIAKACNQLIVAGTVELVAEAYALARMYGVDPATVREAIRGGFAGSKILELQGQKMLDRNFAPGGPIKTHMKDRANVLDAIEASGVDLPVARAAFERAKMVVDRGEGDLDHTAMYTLYDDVGAAVR